MSRKIIVIGFLMLSISSLFIGTVAAQDTGSENRPGNVRSEVRAAIMAETDLTMQEIAQQLRDGATLAEIIERNGGDVEAVIAATVEVITASIDQAVENETITQERADALLENLETRVRDAVNGEGFAGTLRDGFNNRRDNRRDNLRNGAEMMALLQATKDLTELSNADLATAVRESETLAEVITGNGATVDDVVAAATTTITERVNQWVEDERITQEQADEILENLEAELTEMVNSEILTRPGISGNRPVVGRQLRGVINAVSEATGLETTTIAEQVQAGSSLAMILTENGVDVDSFVDEQLSDYSTRLAEQVEAGRISQALADARLNLRRVELTELLNRVPETATDSATI